MGLDWELYRWGTPDPPQMLGPNIAALGEVRLTLSSLPPTNAYIFFVLPTTTHSMPPVHRRTYRLRRRSYAALIWTPYSSGKLLVLKKLNRV